MEREFKEFEKKYHLAPIFRITDGKKLGAFIITSSGESCMISFESTDADIAYAARLINKEQQSLVEQDLMILKELCSPPTTRAPSSSTIQ